MAPNASGSHTLDHQRIMVRVHWSISNKSNTFCLQELGYAAFEFSKKCLKEGGIFVCKLWQGSLLNGKLKLVKIPIVFDRIHNHKVILWTLSNVMIKWLVFSKYSVIQLSV